MVRMVQSYKWAEDNAHLTQKAQIALSRIAVEMAEAKSITPDENNDRIEFKVDDEEKTISFDNGNLLLSTNGDHYLTDRVQGFSVTYDDNDNYFTISLIMKGANDVEREFEKIFAMPQENEE